ncbi:MAG: hypothetical protein OXF21_01020 [bacterium]|nr:hypothetical protein [bacterium]
MHKTVIGVIGVLVVLFTATPVVVAQTVADIQAADQLIANQETLLNTYRCTYSIDTEAVPGGCEGTSPAQGPTQPGTFEGTPTANDQEARNQLIANQETLLNGYRCQLNIDTQLVVDGCPTIEPTSPETDDTTPSEEFNAVSATWSSSCAIRADDTITCWGLERLLDAPSGTFTDIAGGGSHSCAIRTDQTVACWGNTMICNAPSYDDGSLDTSRAECSRNAALDAPSGAFTQIATGRRHSCGIRTDGTVACWHQAVGLDDSPRSAEDIKAVDDVPEGTFTHIAAGISKSCGITVDDAIACWGDNENDRLNAPSGSFTQIAIGNTHSCAIRTDGTLACWGWSATRQPAVNAPSGQFTQIAIGRQDSCGIKVDGTLACWTLISRTDLYDKAAWRDIPAPDGNFIDLAVNFAHACGVKTDNSMICWGINNYGQTDIPT